jgi:hypothetical protein
MSLTPAGLAWWSEKYSKDLALKDLQEVARTAKRTYGSIPIPFHHGSGGIGCERPNNELELWRTRD